MKNAPISVIIPCYCCADVLVRAIDSVVSQTLLPSEIILIDDASDDDGATKACIENIVSDATNKLLVNIRVKYLTENIGAGEARNIALDMCTQPLVAFLDSDDAWVPDKLFVQYEWMLKHPQYAFTCHKNTRLGFSSDFFRLTSNEFSEIRKIHLILRNSIQTSSVMMFNKNEYRFPKVFRYAEDYWLWIHLKFGGVRMAIINSELSISYKSVYGQSGLSANIYKMHKGVLRCFSDLRSTGRIGLIIFIFACSVEVLKFLIRVCITAFGKFFFKNSF